MPELHEHGECPTCSSRVQIVSSTEGTSFYEPALNPSMLCAGSGCSSEQLAQRVIAAEARVAVLEAALREIATRPTVERNPDGEDQGAWTMQLIAKEALGMVPPLYRFQGEEKGKELE